MTTNQDIEGQLKTEEIINLNENTLLQQESHPDTKGEVGHESTLYAEPIFHIGDFTVSNALFTSWIVVFILIVVSVVIRFKIKKTPKGIQNLSEIIIEGALPLCDQVTNDRKITEKAFPIVVAIFMFVLLNNWLGILPVGGFGLIESGEHGKMFIPIIRSGTADINGTLPLAILSVLGANLFGIFSIGLWKTINKFFNFNVIGSILKKIKKDPFVIMTAPIMFAVGLIEFVGEFAKVASLSFRLFGNVFAGEVLLASMGAIFAYLLPTPFILLEVFVGLIQAFIFAILTLVYYTISSLDHDEDHDEKNHNKEELVIEKAV
jgi:F-type H+-transporting ATPase subunit a